MAEILYYGFDERIPEILTNHFADLKRERNQTHTLARAKDEKSMNEYMAAMMFDAILFEQKYVPGDAREYPATFRKARKNFKGKMIIVGDEPDTLKVFKLLDSGWVDYFHLPPDRLAVISKTFLHIADGKSSEKQTFSMKVSQGADLAKPAMIEELSEFECKIKSHVAAPAGELSILYTKAIGENGEKIGVTTARCFKSEKHPSEEGMFHNSYVFVGVGPDTLQNIRNTLRKVYVASKK